MKRQDTRAHGNGPSAPGGETKCSGMKPFQSKHMRAGKQYSLRHTIFFHPDYTVGLGISPNHALRLVGFTTGGESHPALKILIQLGVL